VGAGGVGEVAVLVLLRAVVCEPTELFVGAREDGGLIEVEADGLLLGVFCIVAFSLMLCAVGELAAAVDALSLGPDEDEVGGPTPALTGRSNEVGTVAPGLSESPDGSAVCLAAVATEEVFGVAAWTQSSTEAVVD
jgi:hypothetical protein